MIPLARMRLPGLALLALLLVLAVSCSRREPPRVTVHWVMGASEPLFDPDGPPEARRWALERWLSRGLTDEDSTGRIVPGVAERWEVSSDGRAWTFHLRPDLRFTDGTPCTSADIARALAAGLPRRDHATRVWLLQALRGVDRVRAGRTLPALGIDTPDSATLVLRLSRPDPTLAAHLALPGVSAPWKRRAPAEGWEDAVGTGPFRVLAHEPGRALRLVRAEPGRGPIDTLVVRFAVGAARVRSLLRQGRADLAWPLPPGLLDEPLPPGVRRMEGEARPGRVLALVLRTDTPPTHKLPARAALAHGLNRSMVERGLAGVARPIQEWPVGAGRFEFPGLDAQESRRWMALGELGRSFHVQLGYDADGAGAAVARSLQGEWARLGIDIGLDPVRGGAAQGRALIGGPHLWLAEFQPLLDAPSAALASLVMPLRGPAVGAVRTGWRTREFDPWIWPGARPAGAAFDAAAARRRLEGECVVLPLADLPWVWVAREGAPAGFVLHSRFGPACESHGSSVPARLAR